ncbi:MAG: hypothetical protein PHW77_00005, partial [Eubacteriales bacterium]|nr:hypothetical protein [Eubacteriales bacterium]
MRITKKSVLSLALTTALVLTALISVFAVSATSSFDLSVKSDKSYEVVSGVNYTEYDITSGVNSHVETASALEFSSADYIPMVFSCFAGTSGTLSTQYTYATQKYGYEVAGIINGSFFSMDSTNGSYGTLVGINISNGKISSAHAGYSGEVVAFSSDGGFDVV